MNKTFINQLSEDSQGFFRYYYGMRWQEILENVVKIKDIMDIFEGISKFPRMFPEAYQYDLEKIKLEMLPFALGCDDE